jgi:UDP-N-acetylmuramoyl-L-alanyl-D-glutamate--2,6-diaminopimelate ligase
MDAAFRGASVIVSEEDLDIRTVPVLKVSDSRRVLSKMSANFYENREVPFHLFGITGTNGKTTIAIC